MSLKNIGQMEKFVFFFLCFVAVITVLFSIYHIIKILLTGETCGGFETREDKRRRELERIDSLVKSCSEWYKKVLELHEQTLFYHATDMLDNGESKYYVEVDSKSKFEKYRFNEGLKEFLKCNREYIEITLDMVSHNRQVFQNYEQKFEECHVSTDPAMYQEHNITDEVFVATEKSIVNEKRKSIQKAIKQSYSVTCYVSYRSPRGRNRYQKHMEFDEEDIRYTLKRIDENAAFQSSETRRREIERSKVTPSVRYDIMRRDGFRCCLCGRSADNGVELEVDHIIPISKGGESSYDNLQTLCRDCNRGKGAKY